MGAWLRRDAILIVRVWFEGGPPNDFRASLVDVTDDSSLERVVATVATREALCSAVCSWVEELTSL